jgi:hypothetical protein
MSMADSSIPNLKIDELHKVLDEYNDRFLPNLNDEDAGKQFEKIIEESVNAQFVEMLEIAHQ